MTTTSEVDHFAIMSRYVMGWRPLVLFALAMFMLAVPSLHSLNGEAVRARASRLEATSLFAEDARVTAEAQRRLVALQATWWYRYSVVVRYSAVGVGLLLLIPSSINGTRGRRAVKRAREGRCMACNYDLRGSGIRNACPECGAPPVPFKAAGTRRRFMSRWFRHAAVIFGTFAIYYVVIIRSVGGASILGWFSQWKVERAFDAAPHVQVRWVRVLADDGSWQYAYRRDAEIGFVRQEWWEGGALKDAIADQYGEECVRYLPATGVTRPARENVGPDRLEHYERFADSHVDRMAGQVWYESERIAAGPDRKVYRRVTRSGLHDHHAEDISIVVIDTETRRPLYEWQGTFGVVFEPDAIPPLRRLWITEIEYPESAAPPEMGGIDPERPGKLRADWGPHPSWLDPAWVNPILEE